MTRLAVASRLQIGWSVVIVLTWMVALSSAPLDRDYTSGELLDHVAAWTETGVLYPPLDDDSYRVLNYPPLAFVAVRAMGVVGAAPIAAGRVLSYLGLALVIVVVRRWLRESGVPPTPAAGVTAALAASFAIVYNAGQFHLELLAAGLTVAGLHRLAHASTPRHAAAAALFVALACFVKQTQVVFAATACAWVAIHARRLAPAFGATLLALGASGLALTVAWFGPEAWRHLVTYTVGTYSVGQLLSQTATYALPLAVFFAIAVAMGAAQPALRRGLPWWYFVASSLWLLSAARNGSGHQYYLDWSVAMTVWLAPALATWLAGRRPTERAPRLVAWLLALQLIGANAGVAWGLWYNWTALRRITAAVPTVCRVAGPPEPPADLLVEFPGMARACGHRVAIHPFIMTSLARQGLWDQDAFIGRVRSGAYPVAALPSDPATARPTGRWTPEALEAIAETYREADRTDGWTVFVPR